MREIKREKIWNVKYSAENTVAHEAIREISLTLGVSELFAVLLYNRGYTTAESARRFLRFEETDFHDPFILADMQKAVDRIFAALENKEKICIYGDYDVDGVTSVSMLYLYLTSLGADVTIKIPKREGEGYGVSAAAIGTLASAGVTLIITVDTGITANAEVDMAKELGVDFVVTDHHECHGQLPHAVAVVNPHRPDCPYPFKELAGVGVVFKTVCACEMMRCKLNGQTVIDGVRRVCSEFSDLVAVGTIADVMPLVDENRLIVSLGLAKLAKGEGRPGLQSLLDASSKRAGDEHSRRRVTSGMIGFGIAPRINAAGRISDASIAAELLLAVDGDVVAEYTERLCEINRQRQVEENKIAATAYEMLESSTDYDNDKVIVLAHDEWQQGIIGIVSSRITEKYGLPSILISFGTSPDGVANDADDGKGSGRSIKGLNLVEALHACDDLLVKYGGHELAAGLTVKRGKLCEFRKRINEYAAEHITDDMLRIKIEADCELEMSELNMSFANEISRLEPFGIGNAAPQFVMKGVIVRKLSGISAGKHTKLLLQKNGICVTAMYFGVSPEDMAIEEGDAVDVLFNIDVNEFRNMRSVQMVLHDIRICEEFAKKLDEEKSEYARIRAGGRFTDEAKIVPTREDFARVYTTLRREYRSQTTSLSTKEMLKLLNQPETEHIGYVKLKFILCVFNELQICEIEEIRDDFYTFCISFNANKTSIDKSFILKKLKSQSTLRICGE